MKIINTLRQWLGKSVKAIKQCKRLLYRQAVPRQDLLS